jgi:cytoskeletal protein RodZ
MIRKLLILASIVSMVGCLVMLPESEPEPQSDLLSSAPLPVEPADNQVTTQIPVENSAVEVSHADTSSVTESVAAVSVATAPAPAPAPAPAQEAVAPAVHQAAVNALCREIGNKLGSVVC